VERRSNGSTRTSPGRCYCRGRAGAGGLVAFAGAVVGSIELAQYVNAVKTRRSNPAFASVSPFAGTATRAGPGQREPIPAKTG